MRILIVEDDKDKIVKITSFLCENISNSNVVNRFSYQSGLREILTNSFDLIILDMSLPTYDIVPGESGYIFRHYGGIDILSEMKRKNIEIPTIVVTQYDYFGEGDGYKTLDELRRSLIDLFPETYICTIFYSSAESTWKQDLIDVVKSIGREKKDEPKA